jgi:hypothetical protein
VFVVSLYESTAITLVSCAIGDERHTAVSISAVVPLSAWGRRPSERTRLTDGTQRRAGRPAKAVRGRRETDVGLTAE